jgi:hypothetical protein
MTRYLGIEQFYDEDWTRRATGETDYGVWWREQHRPSPTWRVSYIQGTGEVYANQLGGNRWVEVLGVVPPDEGENYHQTLDQLLEGWSDVCGQPGSLDWVREKVRQAERRMARISLNEQDFRELVMGRAVYQEGVGIILQDIGFHVMEEAIRSAREAVIKPIEPMDSKEDNRGR